MRQRRAGLLSWACLLLATLATGCSNFFQPSIGERDLYVVNTPTAYPDNRVFYVGKTSTTDGLSTVTPSWQLTATDLKRGLLHNSPLSIIVDAVGLPIDPKVQTRDIAIVLDIQTENGTDARSLVVWYQRNVSPGQTLNFKNLLLHSQEQWDHRIAPLFRLRVLDVAAERNIETREALAQASKLGSSLGALIRNPLAQSAIELSSRAASLTLANRANKVIMDYTVQFFDARLVTETGTPNLTPLLVGRFVLVGRSLQDLQREDYWRRSAKLDEYNTTVTFYNTDKSVAARSPGVSIQILAHDLIVPTQVAAKSAYLTKLLTESTTANIDEIKFTAQSLLSEVNGLSIREQILRYRQIAAISELVPAMFQRDGASKFVMPDSTRQSIGRFLRTISGCSAIETESIQKWWDNIKSTTVFKTPADAAKDTPETMGILLKRTTGDLCALT